MSLEALKQILKRADASAAALFNADEVAAWPEGSLGTLRLLREDAPAKVITCPGCDMQCLKEVELIGEGKDTRGLIVCDQRDDMEPIEVPLESLRRWSADVGRLARSLALLLDGSGQAEEAVRGRLWWLGRVSAGPDSGVVFLACGARRDDAADVFGLPQVFRRSALPVVLTLSDVPAEGVFSENVGVVPLCGVLGLEDGQLRRDREAIAQAVRLVSANVQVVQYLFRRDGATWTVTFGGTTKTFADSKGMRYIAFLLEHEGEEFHVLQLAQQVDGVPPPDPRYLRMTAEQLEAEGTPLAGPTSQREIIDDKYQSDVEKEVRRLQESRDIAEAMGDDDAVAALQSEIEAHLTAIAGATGPGGRRSEFADEGEHARQRVQKAVYSSLRAIKRGLPELHTHLKASMLPLGYVVRYRPAAPVDWSF